MLKKNIFFIVLTVLSSFIIVPSHASNYTPDVEKKCYSKNIKVTYNNSIFKCVKSKKSLVWKKVGYVSNSSPAINNDPIKLDTKTVSSVSVKSISEKASDIFIEWAYRNESKKNNHFVYKNNDIPEDMFISINQTEIKAVNIFANFVKKDTFSFYGGEDRQWFYTHNKLVPPSNTANICGAHEDGVAACVNITDSAFFRIPHDNFHVSNRASSLGAHEYFHLVQSSVADISVSYKADIPLWFMEGTSEFVAHSVLSIVSNKKYDALISTNDKIFTGIDGDPYVNGRILIEVLVYQYGFDTIMNIFADYKNSRNFNYVFSKNTGVDIETFLNNAKEKING